jgi:2Fe-2S ferredoxin
MSLMRVLWEAGFDDILALCGGVCSCGTCHVYIDEGADTLPPMNADEDALLEGSSRRRATSRLSCQLLVTDEFDGLRLTVAPED